MVTTEIQKRNKKSQALKVLETDDGQYFVESSDGKILYRVNMAEEQVSCMCGDFTKRSKGDPDFKCKHILAVFNALATGEVTNGSFIEKVKPKLDDRVIAKIKGREFCLYAGLLDMAHQKGLMKIEVMPVQYPTKENGNEAICLATVESKSGEVFVEVGDANPGNVTQMIAEHILRMAATRAKARALRDMTNIGMTCMEELSDPEKVIPNNAPPVKPRSQKRAPAKPTVKPEPKTQDTALPDQKQSVPEQKQSNPEKKTTPATSKKDQAAGKQTDATPAKFSEAQKRAIFNLSRRRGISTDQLTSMCQETYGVDIEQLTGDDAAKFIRTLQTAA